MSFLNALGQREGNGGSRKQNVSKGGRGENTLIFGTSWQEASPNKADKHQEGKEERNLLQYLCADNTNNYGKRQGGESFLKTTRNMPDHPFPLERKQAIGKQTKQSYLHKQCYVHCIRGKTIGKGLERE